jgi:hypothetical protein
MQVGEDEILQNGGAISVSLLVIVFVLSGVISIYAWTEHI